MTDISSLRIGFIGYGKIAQALAWNFNEVELNVVGASNESHSKINENTLPQGSSNFDSLSALLDTSNLVFLTCPDDSIASLCESLNWKESHMVIHCSGTMNSTTLSHAESQGAQTGIFHPLQTISHTLNPESYLGLFTNVTFGITSKHVEITEILERMANLLDGSWVSLNDDAKTPYHIGAIMACGHVTTLLDLSSSLMTKAGLSKLESSEALRTIVNKTIDNYFTYGPISLTGPAARHDKDTVLNHINWLRENHPEILETYTNLTRHSTQIVTRESETNYIPELEDK